jgi:hypothetical protein
VCVCVCVCVWREREIFSVPGFKGAKFELAAMQS